MAKKKTSTQRVSVGATTKTTGDATTTKKSAVAKKPAAKKTTPKKTTRSSAAKRDGLFLPDGGDDHTAAEKSLANAVLAAGGTDKLLSILRHVQAAGGTESAVQALAVYERMRRVLNPTQSEAVAHPLFESIGKSGGDNGEVAGD